MRGVLGAQKRALMVVEPPGDARIGRVLKSTMAFSSPIEHAVVEELVGLVGHASEQELRVGMEPALDEAAEERSRGRAVEAVVVIENSNAHGKAFQLAPKRVSNASGPGRTSPSGVRWPSFEGARTSETGGGAPNGSYGAGGGLRAGGNWVRVAPGAAERRRGVVREARCATRGFGRPASQGEMGSRRAFGFAGGEGGVRRSWSSRSSLSERK